MKINTFATNAQENVFEQSALNHKNNTKIAISKLERGSFLIYMN